MYAVRIAGNDWRCTLRDLLKSASNEVLVCSPFVGVGGAEFISQNLPAGFASCGRIDFLTNLSLGNLYQRSTDPRALQDLVLNVPKTYVHHIPGLHAKAYIADDRHAIITSGNLTSGGLYRNLEYGVVVDDPGLVRTIRSDLTQFATLGAVVPSDALAAYCNALDVVLPLIRTENRLTRRAFHERLLERLTPLEDELLRLRLAGGAMHTVFARTIEYLLGARGPMTTVQMHPIIASIHPDLCDDTIDRVIDGKRFGKKWKHAVRTAQQQLKKQGRVHFDGNQWSLSPPSP